MVYRLIFVFICMQLVVKAQFAPAAGIVGTTAIAADSSIVKYWASSCIIKRGWQDISDTLLGLTSAGDDSFALGKAMYNPTVSLGDGGYAIVQFPYMITNNNGYDFVVFENAFIDSFLELAFVEVSSDGINFFRFNSICNTDTLIQLSNAGLTDATKLNNLAGKYKVGFGVPFDLEELKGQPGLDIERITHVKIIDVIGSIDPQYGTRDSRGHTINDPWPTPFASGGFDLDAVGVIHGYINTGLSHTSSNTLSIFPNPAQSYIYIEHSNHLNQVAISNMLGESWIKNIDHGTVSIEDLREGIYIISVANQNFKLIKN
jgi:hypothetical protein